jgi:hypothetical protein
MNSSYLLKVWLAITLFIFLSEKAIFSQNPCSAPVSNGDKIICEGETIPNLSVIPVPNLQTNWYNMAVGGVLLVSNTTTFTPLSAGVYYAENSDPLTLCTSTRTPIELSVKPFPNVDAGPDQEICIYNCTDLNVTGALVYQWSQGSYEEEITICPTTSQYYTVAGTNIWGCVKVDSVWINVLTTPAPISMGDKIICEGLDFPFLEVSPVAGLNTFWYDQAIGGNLLQLNSDTFQPDSGGIYYAEHRNLDANCFSTRTAIRLEVLPKPTTTLIGNPNLCLGDCRSFVAFGGVNYLWNTGETTNQIEICPSISAQYSVTVSGTNACTDTKTFFVQVDSIPILTLQTAQCAPDLDSYSIEFLASAFDDISSSTGILSNIGTNFNQNLIENNTNTIITATNGVSLCASTLEISASDCTCPTILPPISLGNHALCVGEPIPNLGVQPISENTIFWYNTSTGGMPILKNNTVFQTTQTGLYFAEIIDTITGCASTRTPIRLTIDTLPTANAGEDKYILCLEDFVKLDGSQSSANQGITHFWTTDTGQFIDGEHTQTPLVSASGTYFLTVSVDASGCNSRDSVRVIKRVPPSASFQIKQPLCATENGIIRVTDVMGGTAPFKYAITGQGFKDESFFLGLEPMEYLVVVLDSAGCIWEGIANVEPPYEQKILLDSTIVLKYSEQTILEPQFSFALSSIDTLYWSPAVGLDCYDCPAPMTQLFQTQNYKLTVIDTNGCRTEAFTTVFIKGLSIYAPNALLSSSDVDENTFFTLYSYDGAITEIESLQIFDRWGSKVFENNNFAPNQYNLGWNGTNKGKKAMSGVYFWVASLKLADGKIKKEQGAVTLVRD